MGKVREKYGEIYGEISRESSKWGRRFPILTFGRVHPISGRWHDPKHIEKLLWDNESARRLHSFPSRSGRLKHSISLSLRTKSTENRTAVGMAATSRYKYILTAYIPHINYGYVQTTASPS